MTTNPDQANHTPEIPGHIIIGGQINSPVTLAPQSTIIFTNNGAFVSNDGVVTPFGGQSITNTFAETMQLSVFYGLLTLTPIYTDLAGNNEDMSYLTEGQ